MPERDNGQVIGAIAGPFRETGLTMAADPDVAQKVRTRLAAHHEKYCEMLLRGVDRGDRTAMRLYPELVGLTGGSRDLQAVLLATLGVASLDVARRTLEISRDAGAMDEQELYERALRKVHEYRARHGMPRLIEGSMVNANVGQAEGEGSANGDAGSMPIVRRNGSGPNGNGTGAGHG